MDSIEQAKKWFREAFEADPEWKENVIKELLDTQDITEESAYRILETLFDYKETI